MLSASAYKLTIPCVLAASDPNPGATEAVETARGKGNAVDVSSAAPSGCGTATAMAHRLGSEKIQSQSSQRPQESCSAQGEHTR